MTSDTTIGVPYAPAGVDERGYHLTCPVADCGEKFRAPCCPDFKRTQTRAGVTESHSFGCPALGEDRWVGCSDAEIRRWKEREADEDAPTKEAAALYAAHYQSEHQRRYAADQAVEYTRFDQTGYTLAKVVKYAGKVEQDDPADQLVYVRSRLGSTVRVRESQLRLPVDHERHISCTRDGCVLR
jgi:hypothetical protein